MSNPRKTPLDPLLLSRARSMRHSAAPAEQRLWACLRDRQLGGWKFRRQVPIGAYIADFCCAELKLIVELDGDSHGERREDDHSRTLSLNKMGFEVLRYINTDVFEHFEGVLKDLFEACEGIAAANPLSPRGRVRVKGSSDEDDILTLNTPSPQPSPGGRGGEDCIRNAAAILRAGGIGAFPTETVYGLAADATNAAAVASVFRVKGRPATNPVIVHVGSVESAMRCVTAWPAKAQALAETFWPGPLTLVLPRAESLAPAVSAGKGTVGIRMPDHSLALELLREVAKPLIGPSANRSTRVSPTCAQDVRDELGASIDFILDGGACRVGIESTVLDLASLSPRILRPGAISAAQLEALIGPIEQRMIVNDLTSPASAPGQHAVHYAPATPTYRFESRDRAAAEAWLKQRTSVRIIVLWLADAPTEPGEYARQLYQALRQADQVSPDAIVVEMPPDEPAWLAVRDRLLRAARPLPD